ncbi:unnamed protein product [Gadus morhua 'NCC']
MASTAGGAQAQRGAGSGIEAVDGLALYIWAPETPPSAVRHKSTARYLFLVRPEARAGAAGDLEQLYSENFIPQT